MTVNPNRDQLAPATCGRRGARTAVTAAALLVIGLVGAPPASADATTVGGGAYGAEVRALLGFLSPAPTVELPPGGGGPFTASLPSSTGRLFSTGRLDVRTVGSLVGAGLAESEADAAGVRVDRNPAGPTALFEAFALDSFCRSTSSGSTGSSSFVGGAVNGSPVDFAPAPNTVIEVPLFGTVTLNQQVVVDEPGSTSITVNAVHIHRFPSDIVIIGQSRCSVTGPDVNVPPITCNGQLATIVGTTGDDHLQGTPGPDVIVTLEGDDHINGHGGGDVICGGPGDDSANGGPGNDHLEGNDGDDHLKGGAGNDALDGGPGNDRCSGGGGTNTLVDC